MSNIENHSCPKDRPVILLAEDDPDQSDMLRDRLESEGYAVETAFSGDIALRRLSERDYDAAIMDARMPGQHGGTVLKICGIMKNKTPIIMVSAFATQADKYKYGEDGAVATFSKPLNLPEVLHLLHSIVQTKSWLSGVISK